MHPKLFWKVLINPLLTKISSIDNKFSVEYSKPGLLRFLSQNQDLVENYLHYNDHFDIRAMEIGSMVEAGQRSKVRGVSNNLEFENIGLENVSLYKKLTVSKFVRKQGFD